MYGFESHLQYVEKMRIEKGNKIKVNYTGTLEDGTIVDSSEGLEPLEFEVGSGQLIKGFDEAVIGMNVGEEKEITLKPSEAYGEQNPQMVQKVPRTELLGQEIKEGMMLGVMLPDGQQIPVLVKKIDDKEVIIDFNQPLAGKILKFRIKIIEIIN